jgi:hypothetical protein
MTRYKAPSGKRLDEILKSADERLARFYKAFGEWDGKKAKKEKHRGRGKGIR